MSARNDERALMRICRGLAAARGVTLTSMGEGWILRLEKAGRVRYVHGYTFDLNPAATHAIACDKAACAQVMRDHTIPHIPHELYLHPEMARYIDHPGNWRGMLEKFAAWSGDVVIKDNLGTGGRGVVRCRSEVALEHAAQRLLTRCNGVAISPFVDAVEEHRFIVLAGVCEAAYAKERPSVRGDGRRTVLELLGAEVAARGMTVEIGRFLTNIEPDSAAILTVIPAAGEELLLNWRHNLGQGAGVRMHDLRDAKHAAMVRLAQDAAKAVGLVFGSVDIIVDRAGRASVLEINSGVMMEALAEVPGGAEVASRIYERAFDMMFR